MALKSMNIKYILWVNDWYEVFTSENMRRCVLCDPNDKLNMSGCDGLIQSEFILKQLGSFLCFFKYLFIHETSPI